MSSILSHDHIHIMHTRDNGFVQEKANTEDTEVLVGDNKSLALLRSPCWICVRSSELAWSMAESVHSLERTMVSKHKLHLGDVL